MTTTSLNFRQAAYAAETGRVPIALLTIDHDDLADPIRISTDPTQRLATYSTDTQPVYGTSSNGHDYLFLPLRLTLPDDTDEGPGAMMLEFDNIHRAYTEIIRSISSPATFRLDLVMDNALDTVEMSWPEFRMTNITYTATTITATVTLETMETEPFPAGSFVPSYFPGLY